MGRIPVSLHFSVKFAVVKGWGFFCDVFRVTLQDASGEDRSSGLAWTEDLTNRENRQTVKKNYTIGAIAFSDFYQNVQD